jgi:hypothetical protein
MATKAGIEITEDEAKATHEAIRRWTQDSDPVRNSQKENKPNEDANLISKYIANTTPYNDERFEGIKGEIHRGINFASEKEAMNWLKGDKDGILDNQGAHASWTSREDYAEDYAKRRGFGREGQPVMIKTINKTGVSIKKMGPTEYILQNEVIVPKEAKHKVKNITKKDGIFYVETEEVTNSDIDKKIAPATVQDFTAPRTLGNGTHEGTPKNAQEYSDMMAKKGQKIGIQDAEGVIESVKEWSENAYEIRENQKNGRSSKDADNLDLFIKQSTPFPGEISRGLKFDSEEELNKFVKGEDGILGNQNAHASWTSNYEKAKDFAGMNLSSVKKTYPVIVKAPNKSGVSIRNLSTFGQGEDEVVVSKNTRHKIKSVRKEGDLTIVETEEVPQKIGDGTHQSVPKNAQEYRKMMAEKGNNISTEEAEEVIKSVIDWKLRNDVIRGDQQQGKPNKDADNIDKFIKNQEAAPLMTSPAMQQPAKGFSKPTAQPAAPAKPSGGKKK